MRKTVVYLLVFLLVLISVQPYTVTKSLRDTDSYTNWISTNACTAINKFNDTRYFVGCNAGLFGLFNPVTNVTSSLSTTDTGAWLTGNIMDSVKYNSSHIYIVASGGLFGVYKVSSNITTSLSATDTANWIAASTVYGIESYNNKIYLAINAGKFGVYDPATNVTTDLSATDTGAWMGANALRDIKQAGGKLYVTLAAGRFGVYDPGTNVMTDLSATDTGNWMASLAMYAVEPYNSTLLYLGGASGAFGRYNVSSNVATSLMTTDTSPTANWMGTTGIQSLHKTSDGGRIYVGLAGGLFGYYTPSTNIATSLSTLDYFNWAGASTLTINSIEEISSSRVPFVGTAGTIGEYSIVELNPPNTNTTTSWGALSGIRIREMEIYNATHSYLVGDNGMFYVHRPMTNVTTTLTATDTANWMSTSIIYGLDAVNSTAVYLAAASGKFGVYNPMTNITTDLSATDTGNWMAANAVYSVKSTNPDEVYVTVGAGLFGRYKKSENVMTALGATDTGNWISTSIMYALAPYNSTRIYIGGASGKFGYYDSSTNVTTSLSATDVGAWMTGTVNYIYKFNDSRIYIGLTSGQFGYYDKTLNIIKSLTATDTFPVNNWIDTKAIYYVYAPNSTDIYFAGANGLLGYYKLSTNTSYSIMDNDYADWIGNSEMRVFLPINSTRSYIGGTNYVWGVYNTHFMVDGEVCVEDKDCWSKNCDLDLLGFPRCHATASSCIVDETAIEVPNGGGKCYNGYQNNYCTDSVWSALTTVTAGKVCQAGSEVAPSGGTDCGTGAQNCYCAIYRDCVTDSCSAQEYYVGFTAGGACDATLWTSRGTSWNVDSSYRISVTTQSLTCTMSNTGGTLVYDSCANQYTRSGLTGYCDGSGGNQSSAPLTVLAGTVCRSGNGIAPSGNSDCGTGAQNCYCDIYKNCVINECLAGEYYIGFTSYGACDVTSWVSTGTSWNVTENYRISAATQSSACTLSNLGGTPTLNYTGYCNGFGGNQLLPNLVDLIKWSDNKSLDVSLINYNTSILYAFFSLSDAHLYSTNISVEHFFSNTTGLLQKELQYYDGENWSSLANLTESTSNIVDLIETTKPTSSPLKLRIVYTTDNSYSSDSVVNQISITSRTTKWWVTD